MLNKFLNFDEMVTPLIIKIVYWIGIGLCVIAGLITIIFGVISGGSSSGGMVIGGLLCIVLGPLFVRMGCEASIIMFEIHKNLIEINQKTPQRPN